MRLNRSYLRLGFSMIEVLTVMVIFGVVVTLALPKLVRLRDQGQLATAQNRFIRAVMAARQAAIQRGKHAYFKTSNSDIWVILDTTGINTDSVIITSKMNLGTEYGVSVTSPSGLTSIEYDPRGVSTQNTKQNFAFRHNTSGIVDSLCVSKLGNTIRDRCP